LHPATFNPPWLAAIEAWAAQQLDRCLLGMDDPAPLLRIEWVVDNVTE